MSDPVSYAREGAVAVITMDDGKANALSPSMQTDIHAALDRAQREADAIVLAGRPSVFSAGFDLKILRRGQLDALKMVRGGFELAARLLELPRPVVLACTGHAVAMGAFLVLSGDYRVGARGDFKLQANEVAIGLTMPRAGVEICRQRLAPAHFQRAALLAEPYDPESAVAAGFLDRVVDADEVVETALEHAAGLAATLDLDAHAATKARARAATVRAIRRGIASDVRELALMGARRLVASRLPGRRAPRAS